MEAKAEADEGQVVDPDATVFRPGEGLRWTTDDEAFELRLGARVQLRDDVTVKRAPDETRVTHGFAIRRARVDLKGNAFGRHNRFEIQLAFSPDDLDVENGTVQRTPLLDWFIELTHLRDLTLRAGQYRVPYSHEAMVSSANLQFVDRSLANEEMDHTRDVGMDLRSTDVGGVGLFRYYAGVYMGEGRDFAGAGANGDLELRYVARVEASPSGAFPESDALLRPDEPQASVGAAYAFHHGARRDPGIEGEPFRDGGTANQHAFTVDYHGRFGGLSSMGAFHWRRAWRRPGPPGALRDLLGEAAGFGPTEPARNGVAWFVQVAYLLPRSRLELAARYSGLRALGPSSLGDEDSAGGALSYYFQGHPFKLQADMFMRWSDDGVLAGDTVIRSQLQLTL